MSIEMAHNHVKLVIEESASGIATRRLIDVDKHTISIRDCDLGDGGQVTNFDDVVFEMVDGIPNICFTDSFGIDHIFKLGSKGD